MQNWIKKLINNNQPLKRVGGLTFNLNWRIKMQNTITEINENSDEYYETYEAPERNYSDVECWYCGKHEEVPENELSTFRCECGYLIINK